MLSPILWTTIATGKTPDLHRIRHFVAINEAGGAASGDEPDAEGEGALVILSEAKDLQFRVGRSFRPLARRRPSG